ncbi:hypothetical protein QWA68_014729 [Fusarium oxysporum]|nr:hypothetical protein QWA68_014729 [Fusarium oxysporum]
MSNPHTLTSPTTELRDLISPDQTDLFDALDRLSALNVAKEIQIPQLVVVGDQSSGKSSVLEAIAGYPFPVDDQLCTRFPTKLIMRRSKDRHFRVSIEPGKSRDDAEKIRLLQFSAPTQSGHGLDLGGVVKKAAGALGVHFTTKSHKQTKKISNSKNAKNTSADLTQARDFADDVLKIQICGPDLPLLSLVDLPGLFRTQSTEQGGIGMQAVTKMIESYVKMRRTITLLVVSARMSYHNHEGPARVQNILQVDAGLRDRVVGVVTSPDEAQSPVEMFKLLNGQLDKLNLTFGWHVVRNRSRVDRDVGKSLWERDDEKRAFFHAEDWKDFPKSWAGIAALRQKLGDMLCEHTRIELPAMILEVKSKADIIQSRLEAAGPSRATDKDRRLYLNAMAKRFEGLMIMALYGAYVEDVFKTDYTRDGQYQDNKPFFAPFGENGKENQETRLRANIRALNKKFAQTIRAFGKTKIIEEAETAEFFGVRKPTDDRRLTEAETAEFLMYGTQTDHKTTGDSKLASDGHGAFPPSEIERKYYSYSKPELVKRKSHERWVAENIERWRQMEPRGEASESAYWGLFEHQSARWNEIARNHVQAVWDLTTRFIELALEYCVDRNILPLLKEHIINARLEELKRSLHEKLNDLLRCHRRGNTGFYDGFIDVFTLKEQTRALAERLVTKVPKDMASHGELLNTLIKGLQDLYVTHGDRLPLDGVIGDTIISRLGCILEKAWRSGKNEIVENVRRAVMKEFPAEMESFTALRVVEQVETSYQINLVAFVGYVNALVIENALVKKLPGSIFCQELILKADNETIDKIAAERESDVRRREQDQMELAELREIVRVLERYSA